MSERPQILLVPSWSEVQWAIKPLLAEWADVASFDPPGVGAEPPAEGRIPEAIVARGAAEIDECLQAPDIACQEGGGVEPEARKSLRAVDSV